MDAKVRAGTYKKMSVGMSTLFVIGLSATCIKVDAETTFKADPQAIAFLKYMIRDDFSHYMDGGQAIFSYHARVPALRVAAPALVAEYRRDPEAADARYQGKTIRLVGAIRSMKVHSDGDQYANFVGGYSDFEDPQGNFGREGLVVPDSTDSYVCIVTEKLGPSVRLDRCVSYDRETDYGNQYFIPAYVNEQLNAWFAYGVVPAFLAEQKQDRESVLFSVYWVGTKLSKKPSCWRGQATTTECLKLTKELLQAAKSGDDNFQESYKAAKDFLKLSPSPKF